MIPPVVAGGGVSRNLAAAMLLLGSVRFGKVCPAGQSGARASRRRSISWGLRTTVAPAPGDQGDTTTAQAYAD